MAKLVRWSALVVVSLVILAGAIYLLSIYGRPPRPVALGKVVWDYETGFTVTGVTRTPLPGGERYTVHIRVFCPYGERYQWSSSSAHVIDNDGKPYYAVAGTPAHKVLGASDSETMIFNLPRTIEQPALVFDDTQEFVNIFDELRVGRIYERYRFNLRYD